MVEERLWQKVDFEGAPTSLYKIEIQFKHLRCVAPQYTLKR